MPKVKDMISVTVGAIFGGETIRQIGNTSFGASGIGKATKSLVGVGVLGSASKLVPKGWFK